MPRPPKCRFIDSMPGADYFKPRGIPLAALEVTRLGVDEYEAMRLYDVEGLDQEQAAARMNVSRATFGRILNSAHGKTAGALVYGRAIMIEGGSYQLSPDRRLGPVRGFGGGRCRAHGGRGGARRGGI